jgi:DNA primase
VALFDQTFKDEVRAKNDIVEVVSSYVKLERRGNRYVGLCPFHGEKTPSFHVIPDLQIYHCFGCKASGDVFKFIMERDQMSFYETLVLLAKRARIPLPQEERTPEEEQAYRERRAMYDALDLATRFFHSQLLSDPGREAHAYLLDRGLTDESIRQFRLGWAPGYGKLYQALRSRFSPQVQQKVGLAVPRREGSGFMDAFFDRVMFPITDLNSRVIGFGGRILNGNGPKYKNTADTPLFIKRNVLFGLAQAKEAIRASNQAILVEGYMDVIMPHQVGIKNVIAPLGTALTDEQCKVLHQQAQQVIVAFDSDTAGQMATLRGLEKLYDTGCDVRILRLPDGKDPDEFIRAHGAEGFQRCVAEAMPLVEFKLRRALEQHPATVPGSKAQALEAVSRVLMDIKSEVLRAEYVDLAVNLFSKWSPDLPDRNMKIAIDRQMNRLLQQGSQHSQWNSRNNIRDSGFAHQTPLPHGAERPGPGSTRPVDKPLTRDDLAWRAERTLLHLLLQYPGLLARIRAELGESPLSDPVHSAVYQVALVACSSSNAMAGPIVARVLDTLSDPDARLVVTEMATNPLVSADSEQEAGDCIEKIQQHRVSRRIEDLENLMKAQQAAGQPADHAVLQEYMQLQLQRKKPSKS